MRTLQGMRMNVDYMMEQIRINAINDTFEKFKKADRHYYETSEGGSEVTKLIKELEELEEQYPHFKREKGRNYCCYL